MTDIRRGEENCHRKGCTKPWRSSPATIGGSKTGTIPTAGPGNRGAPWNLRLSLVKLVDIIRRVLVSCGRSEPLARTLKEPLSLI